MKLLLILKNKLKNNFTSNFFKLTEIDTCWLAFAEVVRKNHGNNIAGRSSDSSLAFKQIFNDYGEIWKESRWKVTQLLSEVRRPSADCQSTFSRRFKPLGILLKKSLNGHATVVGGHATVGRLSNNDFSTFQAIRNFLKKSLNGHATVVGGHATVGRLSNNVFWTFQAIWENFEKSRWTVTRQWLKSRDRRPTVKQRFLDVSSI